MRNGKWIRIENAGEVDVRLLEMIGATSKTGEDGKIGVFGSGSDYALAQAMRLGLQVVAFSGESSFEFKTVVEKTERGDFNRIAYSAKVPGKPPKLVRLSLTDQFGAQHWTNPWFIIREFYANALDEGGAGIAIVHDKPTGVPGTTRFWITASPDLVKIVKNLGDYFRPYDPSDSSQGRILGKAEGKGRVYRRGVFVQEMDDLYFNYDLYNLRLSETRTADTWEVRHQIRYVFAQTDEATAEQLLGLLMDGAFEGKAEGDLDWSWYSMDAAWTKAFHKRYGEEAVICMDNNNAVESALEVRKKPVVVRSDKWRTALKKAGVPTVEEVVGEHACEGIRFIEESEWTERERQVVEVAKAICATALGQDTVDRFPVRIYREKDDLTLGRYFESLKVVGLSKSVFPKGVREVAETLAEEYGHGLSHATDKTRSFQNFLLERLIDVTLQMRGELY